MSAMKSTIVFIMLLVPSLCDDHPNDGSTTLPPIPDFGSPEEFLKEVNEYRAKFAKEHKIPNMYKLAWSNELVGQIANIYGASGNTNLLDKHVLFSINSYRNVTRTIYVAYEPELRNPLKTFTGCAPHFSTVDSWYLYCLIGFGSGLESGYVEPGEAGSRCPPRFKGENGLCVPVDPSKHTFWGTKEGLLEDVNYMRRTYAKKYRIPNMHQLTWNESLVVILKALDLKLDGFGYLHSNDSSWDGFGKNWRITELVSFSAAVPTIDEAVGTEPFAQKELWEYPTSLIRVKEENVTVEQMIHPLQTSIGCMKKEREKRGEKYVLTACLLGNIGQWPSDWKIDANSTKIPGSECMDGYFNDDGLCVVAPPTTTPGPTTPTTPEATTTPKTTEKTTPNESETVPATAMKPEASDEKKKKEGASVEEDAELEPGQEALESSVTTRIYSYEPWIFMIICLLS
ncbi:unnamed protein product [Caenorhabditis brenneri]